MKLKAIQEHLETLKGEALLQALADYKVDERIGVQKLCDKYAKRHQKEEDAKIEWQDKLDFDSCFHHHTYTLVGVDEVGRGPLAGPVVAAAVILPYNCQLIGLKDSKKLSEDKREELYDSIMKKAIAIGVGIVDAEVIDEINILQATFLAMQKALSQIEDSYDVILVDGDKMIPKVNVTQHAVIKGDDKSGAIAAASVIAKVTRDRMMKDYSKTYTVYDWLSNKGYGSAKHYEGIRQHGITPLHRKTFLKNEV